MFIKRLPPTKIRDFGHPLTSAGGKVLWLLRSYINSNLPFLA